MAIFDQIPLKHGSGLPNVSSVDDEFAYTCLDWHTASHLLVLGRRNINSEQGEVVFFQSDGSQCYSNATDVSAQSASHPLVVAFHPTMEYIVVAWSDGMLSAFHPASVNSSNNESLSNAISCSSSSSDQHVLQPQGSDSRVKAIWWSQHGQAFVTANGEGGLSVWLVSESASSTSATVIKRAPRKLATYQLSSFVAHVAFIENRYSSIQQTPIHGVPLGIKPSTPPPPKSGEKTSSRPPLVEFIAVTSASTLFYCTDTIQKQLVQLDVNTVAVTMQANASTAGGRGLKLSVAGADFTVKEWKLTTDPLQLTDTNTLRLTASSSAGGSGSRENDTAPNNTGSSIISLDNDVWATANGERFVRIWDFKRSINALLKLDAFSSVQEGEVVQRIRYAKHSGLLVGATNFGGLVIWKRVQQSSSSGELDVSGGIAASSATNRTVAHQHSSSNLSGWEALSSMHMRGVVVRQLRLHDSAMLLAIINGASGRDAWILRERQVVKTFLHPLAAIQTSAHTILLEDVESSAVDVVEIENNKPIACIALSASHLVVGYPDSSLSSYVWRSENRYTAAEPSSGRAGGPASRSNNAPQAADSKRIRTTMLRTYDETFDYLTLYNDTIVICMHDGSVRMTTVTGALQRTGIGYAIDDMKPAQQQPPQKLTIAQVQTDSARLLCVYDNIRICISELTNSQANASGMTCPFGELDVADRLQQASSGGSAAAAGVETDSISDGSAKSTSSNLVVKLAELDATGKRVAFCCSSATDVKQHTMLYVWDGEFNTLLWFDLNARSCVTCIETHTYSAVSNSFAAISYHCADQLAWQTNYPQFLVVYSRAIADLPFPSSAKERARIARRPRVNLFIIPPENKHQQLNNMLVLSSSETLPSSDQSSFLGARLPHVYLCRRPRGESSSITSTSTSSASTAVRRLMEARVLRDFQQYTTSTSGAANNTSVAGGGQTPVSLDAIIKFTYHIALGQVEEAINSVKGMRSETTWQHLARHCVLEQKLEYAQMCLGQMRDAFTAMTLQRVDSDTKTTDEGERRLLKLGHLALSLNMTQEAEQFWRSIDRHDLVCRLKMSQGEWDEAFEVSFSRDRILQPLVHYKLAEQSLVLANCVDDAIPHFEASHAGVLRVPRALASQQDFQALERFVSTHKGNADICVWYANFLESRGETDDAVEWYRNASDFASVVRLYCNNGKVEKAIELVESTNNASAAFRLAEHLDRETDNSDTGAGVNPERVIHFYGIAKAYWHALQYCKKHNLLDQLVNFALKGSNSDMLEAAQFLEDRIATAAAAAASNTVGTASSTSSYKDKLVLLYQKAGYVGRAVELAFENEMYHSIDIISNELDQYANKELVKRCADFFLSQQQLDRAVALFARTGNYFEAIAMCARNNVRLTEDLVAQLIPPAAAAGTRSGDGTASAGVASVPSVTVEYRRQLLRQLAELCNEQALFALAARLYGEAGAQVEAARALIQLTSADGSSGVEQLVRFARTSRNEQVYVLVANFLQRLWVDDRSLEQPIVFFYKKARSLQKLAAFYNTQAEAYIDEEADYEKARNALLFCTKELQALLSAGSDPKTVQSQGENYLAKVQAVATRVENTSQNVDRYLTLKQLVDRKTASDDTGDDNSPMAEVQQQQAVAELRELLDNSDWNRGVRTHHVLVLVIKWAVHGRNWRVAYQALERLRNQSPAHVPVVTDLLQPSLIQLVYKQVDERVPSFNRHQEKAPQKLVELSSNNRASTEASAPAESDNEVVEEDSS